MSLRRKNGNSTLETVNPATGEMLASYRLGSWETVARRARKANETYRNEWSLLTNEDRTSFLTSLAKSIRSKRAEYARTITEEMGKPITQAEAEVEKCAWTAEVFASKNEEWLSDDPAQTDAQRSFVAFNPTGVILGIMPWNFPFWQALRFAIPCMAAGNTAILRHSNVCPGSALAIEEAFVNAGFPEGAFQTIVTDHETVARLIESDLIRGVSLTGSVDAGRRIGELAGRSLKKCVLELGGSDPFIVLGDADVEQAARVGAEARLINSGQSCIAAKRFIVVRSVASEFVERFVEEFRKKRTGDPMDRGTDVGPLVNREAVQKTDAQVREATAKGARATIRGGPRRNEKGAFYDPTVLTNVTPKMRVMREEVFAPVAPVYVVDDEDEAIRVANDSEFGLGASLWTGDLDGGEQIARRIESGQVFVNALVKSDPRVPFGGVKDSGVGRELAKYGLHEFTNIKSVLIYRGEQAHEPQIE